MPIGEICKREVVVAQREDTVLQAAKLMRQHHVGDVMVVDDGGKGKRVPVGIVTDRDLVVEVVAPELNPNVITVGDIMVSDFATVKENAGVFESIQYMRVKGVRRMPVVTDDDALIGVVTLDDLLALLSEELDALVKLVAHEQQKEAGIRR
ncbi:CBS domain-containing protein [Nitrosomonas sp. Is37]|uniref:CBS domain-containing protein n=1 Tax=Nitrosomonas sp. Is37 TaxID=3080535 RepID=UPI00294B39A0|nr:CBS domain-containing protein [Nitrosomonas sp. Is37]MDV6345504.1 CBS domain-containing protein [Nitrosomonas sp. Is37]